MFNVATYLNRIKSIALKDEYLRGTVINAVQEVTGAKIEPTQIKFSGADVILKNVGSALRSEILLKKGKLLSLINSSELDKKIKDVR